MSNNKLVTLSEDNLEFNEIKSCQTVLLLYQGLLMKMQKSNHSYTNNFEIKFKVVCVNKSWILESGMYINNSTRSS